ncbi:MAG: ABC transporter substrate-binding protein, partial [Lachnospiraceae bacterium]
MKKNLKTIAALIPAVALTLSAAGCSSTSTPNNGTSTAADTTIADTTATDTTVADTTAADTSVYKIGICNYVDDASLNQIVSNIETQLASLGNSLNVTFEIETENCMADPTVLDQIIANFIADDVDLMVGVATPVAMAMQAATEDNQIPVVFAAVSDPVASGLVESLEAPGANITGTSDYLDTNAVMNLIFAIDEDADYIGLLYDQGQDSSTTAIAAAKEYLESNNIDYVERTGTTVDEVMLAADALIADGVDAIFTPSDNTIMTAELSIYEKLAEAKIPHY